MNKGFVELSAVELSDVNGGGFEGLGEAIKAGVDAIAGWWSSMWREVGRNLYHTIND